MDDFDIDKHFNSVQKTAKTSFIVNIVIAILVLGGVAFGCAKCASWVSSGDAAKDVGSQVKEFKESSK